MAGGGVQTALERFGRIDILCQNAGIFPYHLIDEIDERNGTRCWR